jgi:hypothetical protein
MANIDRPHGFNCKGPSLRVNRYTQDASDSTAIFKGDVVDMDNDGNVSPAAVDSIVKIGAAETYSEASTATTNASPMILNDHPSQLYFAQDDAATTSAQTDMGNSVDHVAGAGSTTTLLSAHELGLGSLSTSNGGFVLLGLLERPDNAFGANADIVCQLNVGEGLLTVAGGI